MSITTISPAELNSRRGKSGSLDLIDVRTPVEFREVHVEYARNVPLDQFDPKAVLASRQGQPSDPVYVICKSGARGRQAAEKLQRAGFENVVNVEGGTAAAEQAGVPVVRGKKAMSIERQVRIAAGSIVLIGVGLAYFVHPWLIGISAFVGAGLVFAGITDTCGMGLMLARMPWNR